MVKRMKGRFSRWLRKLFKKKNAKIGIYGPPNAGKTTLANRIVKDWSGKELGGISEVPHETRRAKRIENVVIQTNNNSSITIDIVDTPGLATKIDFHDFMAFDLAEDVAKARAKEATEGVIEAIKWMNELDGIILVMDASQDPFTQVNVTVIGNVEARSIPVVIAANKIDLPDASPSRLESAFPQHPIVPISALEGENIQKLYNTIAEHFR